MISSLKLLSYFSCFTSNQDFLNIFLKLILLAGCHTGKLFMSREDQDFARLESSQPSQRRVTVNRCFLFHYFFWVPYWPKDLVIPNKSSGDLPNPFPVSNPTYLFFSSRVWIRERGGHLISNT